MGVDTDGRVLAFGDFNGDQLYATFASWNICLFT